MVYTRRLGFLKASGSVSMAERSDVHTEAVPRSGRCGNGRPEQAGPLPDSSCPSKSEREMAFRAAPHPASSESPRAEAIRRFQWCERGPEAGGGLKPECGEKRQVRQPSKTGWHPGQVVRDQAPAARLIRRANHLCRIDEVGALPNPVLQGWRPFLPRR
jgi:hypothetical protein